MTSKTFRKPIAALIGSTFVGAIGLAGIAHAASQPLFVAQDLDSHVLLAAADDAEGKCGEGKCGESATDESDGEGSCGEATDGEGSCGAA